MKMIVLCYQDVEGKEIFEIIDDDGIWVKVIVGEFWGKCGLVDGIVVDFQYFDVFVFVGVKKMFKIDIYCCVFVYVF